MRPDSDSEEAAEANSKSATFFLFLKSLFTPHICAMSSTSCAPIVLGSRKSDLALWQALEVLRLLESDGLRSPDAPSLCVRTEASQGDLVLDRSLSALASGNPGLFTKELEVGLVSCAYDMAVHSLKDMPTTLPQGLALAGISARDDPRDAIVLSARHAAAGLSGLEDLPPGSIVGTSSLRREAFLRRFYPHLRTALVRGNLNTRLRKLDAAPATGAGGSSEPAAAAALTAAAAAAEVPTCYDALLLAAAGLKRMGWANRITAYPSTEDCPYGVGQGALGIECREGDARAQQLARDVTHPASALRCLAERAFLRALQGGCQVPIGVSTSLLHQRTCSAAAAGALRGGSGSSGSPLATDLGAVDEAEGASGGSSSSSSSGGSECAVYTLVLRGTVTSCAGSASLTVEVSRAVSIPRGRVLCTVGTHGLEAVRSAAWVGDSELRLGAAAMHCGGVGGGGGVSASGATAAGAGSTRVHLGVTEAEWASLVATGEEVGLAAAQKLVAVSGAQALLEQLGLDAAGVGGSVGGAGGGGPKRPITYGALEEPADR